MLEQVQYRWQRKRAPTIDIERFAIEQGERVFLHGPSGSGKSTLLNILVGVIQPEHGTVRCLDRSLTMLSHRARDQFRADHLGIIFQQFNLVPYLSVLENVALPCRFSPRRRRRAGEAGVLEEAKRLLEALELGSDIVGRPVTQLSVGQQQRVAVARALIGKPEIIIADEPTSALDADRREQFLNLLLRECAAHGTTLLFVSHDLSLDELFMRTVSLRAINRAPFEEAA